MHCLQCDSELDPLCRSGYIPSTRCAEPDAIGCITYVGKMPYPGILMFFVVMLGCVCYYSPIDRLIMYKLPCNYFLLANDIRSHAVFFFSVSPLIQATTYRNIKTFLKKRRFWQKRCIHIGIDVLSFKFCNCHSNVRAKEKFPLVLINLNKTYQNVYGPASKILVVLWTNCHCDKKDQGTMRGTKYYFTFVNYKKNRVFRRELSLHLLNSVSRDKIQK